VLYEWANYFVTLTEFRSAVFDKALDFSKQQGGRAWIVDSSKAKGVFSDDIQQFIATQGFKLMFQKGVKHFITIRSAVSTTTNMTIARYEKVAGPAGIGLVTVDSLEDALHFLAEVDAGRVAA
jgi:hypothetical protein